VHDNSFRFCNARLDVKEYNIRPRPFVLPFSNKLAPTLRRENVLAASLALNVDNTHAPCLRRRHMHQRHWRLKTGGGAPATTPVVGVPAASGLATIAINGDNPATVFFLYD
jgi:hypothetical protein